MTTPGDTERAVRRQAHREISAGLKRKGFSARTRAFLDGMVFDFLDWKEAAREAGIKIRTAKFMLGHPRIQQELHRRALTVRTTESARNPILAAEIRNRGMAPDANAATMKVALEAARFLEGSRENSTSINVGVALSIPGYVINLEGPSEGPKVINPPAAPRVIDHEPHESEEGPWPRGVFNGRTTND